MRWIQGYKNYFIVSFSENPLIGPNISDLGYILYVTYRLRLFALSLFAFFFPFFNDYRHPVLASVRNAAGQILLKHKNGLLRCKLLPLKVRFHMRRVTADPLRGSPPSDNVSLRARAYRITASWNAPTKLLTCHCHQSLLLVAYKTNTAYWCTAMHDKQHKRLF